jgi:hypothetical protein
MREHTTDMGFRDAGWVDAGDKSEDPSGSRKIYGNIDRDARFGIIFVVIAHAEGYPVNS